MTPAAKRLALLCTLLLSVAVCASEFLSARAASNRAEETRITFNRDLAPIVFRTCAPCHHPGEAGPFSLLTYGDLKSHARQIADVTQKRIMPPWLLEPGEWKFSDDLHLSPEEIALFQKWVQDGMPEGSPSDLPPAPHFNPGWQLGQPDLILRADSPFEVPANGSDVYWNFILNPNPSIRTAISSFGSREQSSSPNRREWLCVLIPATIWFSTHTCSRRAKLKKFSPQSAFISPRNRPQNFRCFSSLKMIASSIFPPAIPISSLPTNSLFPKLSLSSRFIPTHTISRAICSPRQNLPAAKQKRFSTFPVGT